MNQYALITTLVGAIVLAFVFRFIAQRLKLSPIVGNLIAGIAIGRTPAIAADIGLALELSEIGVMCGVGCRGNASSGHCAGLIPSLRAQVLVCSTLSISFRRAVVSARAYAPSCARPATRAMMWRSAMSASPTSGATT